MKKILLAAAIAMPIVMPSLANAYQFEAGLDFATGDEGEEIDIDSASVFGTFYLSNVDDSLGPRSEAAFLNKSSFVTAEAFSEEESQTGFEDVDTDLLGIGGRYVVPDSDFIIEASLVTGEIDNGAAEIDSDAFALSGGKYFNERFSMLVNYSNVEIDDLSESDTYGVSAKYVSEPGENGNALGWELSWSTTETEFEGSSNEGKYMSIGLSPSIYVGTDLTISFDWTITTTDLDGYTYNLDVEYFVLPNVSVSAGYFRTDYNTIPGIDEDDIETGEVWSLGVTGRF